MKFMITFTHIDGVWEKLTPAERESHNATLKAFVTRLRAEKKAEMCFFHPPKEARTVRLPKGGPLEVNDGPWPSEGPEFAGGFFIIDADSIEEAMEWARKSRWLPGANEVRQLVDQSVVRQMLGG